MFGVRFVTAYSSSRLFEVWDEQLTLQARQNPDICTYVGCSSIIASNFFSASSHDPSLCRSRL